MFQCCDVGIKWAVILKVNLSFIFLHDFNVFPPLYIVYTKKVKFKVSLMIIIVF